MQQFQLHMFSNSFLIPTRSGLIPVERGRVTHCFTDHDTYNTIYTVSIHKPQGNKHISDQKKMGILNWNCFLHTGHKWKSSAVAFERPTHSLQIRWPHGRHLFRSWSQQIGQMTIDGLSAGDPARDPVGDSILGRRIRGTSSMSLSPIWSGSYRTNKKRINNVNCC